MECDVAMCHLFAFRTFKPVSDVVMVSVTGNKTGLLSLTSSSSSRSRCQSLLAVKRTPESTVDT